MNFKDAVTVGMTIAWSIAVVLLWRMAMKLRDAESIPEPEPEPRTVDAVTWGTRAFIQPMYFRKSGRKTFNVFLIDGTGDDNRDGHEFARYEDAQRFLSIIENGH